MLNIHGQELEDLSHSSFRFHNKILQNIFCLQNFLKILEIYDKIICICWAHHNYVLLERPPHLIGWRADPLENLPGAFCVLNCDPISRRYSQHTVRSPVPAGSIYINYEFMHPFSPHNNLALVPWCISKKFHILNLNYPHQALAR